MTPEQLRLDEARAWLNRAHHDLKGCGTAHQRGEQAAEKALKGFLSFQQKPFGKAHVLRELRPDCLAIDPTLEPILVEADVLTQYVWKFRYPGAPYEPGQEEAAQMRASRTGGTDDREPIAILGRLT